MTDRDFDRLLYQGAAMLPPESLEGQLPNPWKPALTKICWGLALTSITLNFLTLNYLLPAIGGVLMWLGFRSLRRENPWLGFGHVLSALLLAARLAVDAALATPLSPVLQGDMGTLLGLGYSILTWLLYLSLWQGLRQVFRQAGLPPQTRAAGRLVIWYTLILLLALVQASGWLLLLPLLLAWIFTIRGLYRTSRCLDQAGYEVTPASVRLSDRWAALVWLGVGLAAVVACLLLFARYPVQGTPAQQENGQSELRQELLELGFPREVLDDLTDEEVALLEGAEAVMVKSDLSRWNTRHEIDHISTHFIQVELPEDMVRYLVWFSWDEAPSSRLREGLEIIPDWTRDAILPPDDLQGRLLWEEDGQLYQSPLSGGYGIQTQNSIFFGASSHQSFSIDFSLPRQGERIRGYMTYQARIQLPELTYNYNAEARYVHQERWLSYPWETPLQHQWQSWNNTDEVFPARQFLTMFTLNMDEMEME